MTASSEGSAAAPLALPTRIRWATDARRGHRGIDNGAMELTLRPMARGYLPYSIDQRLLLPPDMREWLPEGTWRCF